MLHATTPMCVTKFLSVTLSDPSSSQSNTLNPGRQQQKTLRGKHLHRCNPNNNAQLHTRAGSNTRPCTPHANTQPEILLHGKSRPPCTARHCLAPGGARRCRRRPQREACRSHSPLPCPSSSLSDFWARIHPLSAPPCMPPLAAITASPSPPPSPPRHGVRQRTHRDWCAAAGQGRVG